MGEAILKKLLSVRPDADQWHVESAGILALEGSGAAFHSKYVMELMGMDISPHRSQPISLKMLRNFDLILTMEEDQKDWLQAKFGDFSDRIYLLTEMVGDCVDISDPIGGELSDYMETAQLLEHILSQGLDRICQLAMSTNKA
jgi:protein-tyrosine phosphatase